MYSWGEIVRSLPKKKNSKSSLWVKWIIRKLSFPFTFLFINLGFSAWGASVLSIFVALAGCAALCVDSALWRAVGVVLVELWLVMDCVDGNIARVKKTSSPMCGCIDAFSGYFITAFVFFSVGVSACYSTRFTEHAGLWVAMGGLSSAFGLLARLIHQKYTCCVLESQRREKNGADGENIENNGGNIEVNRGNGETYRTRGEASRGNGETHGTKEEVDRANKETHRANGGANRENGEAIGTGVQTAAGKENAELLEKGGRLSYLRSRLDKEIGISGLFMPFLIVACIFRLYDVMTVFYFIFQGAGALAAAVYYALKTRENV